MYQTFENRYNKREEDDYLDREHVRACFEHLKERYGNKARKVLRGQVEAEKRATDGHLNANTRELCRLFSLCV